MGFGLLMQDNTPVDRRYRGMGYVPGGPYFSYVPGGPYYGRRGFGIPPGVAARIPQYNGAGASDLPGTPETFGRFGGFSARRFGASDVSSVPGIPDSFGFGDDYDANLQPDATVSNAVYNTQASAQSNQGGSYNWQAAANATGQLATSLVNAFTNSQGQAQCPPGYYNMGNGQCALAQSNNTGLLVAAAVGIGALIFFMRR